MSFRLSHMTEDRRLWLAQNVLPHERALRAWLSRRRPSGIDVDDVVQETYAKLIALESVQNIRNPKSYLYQTAYSIILSYVRRSKVVRFESLSDLDELALEANNPTPEHQVIARDELRRLADAIAELPARVKEVFTLRRVHGLSQRQVAQRLGLAESTVEKHMGRSLVLLGRLLGSDGKRMPRASKTSMKEERRDYAKGDGTRD